MTGKKCTYIITKDYAILAVLILLLLLPIIGMYGLYQYYAPIEIVKTEYQEAITGISGCRVSTANNSGIYCCYGGCGLLGGCDYEMYCKIGNIIKYSCTTERRVYGIQKYCSSAEVIEEVVL